MKVVIIADNLENNAPGEVFKKIIKGLSAKMDFDIITTSNVEVKEFSSKTFCKPLNKKGSWTIRTLFFIVMGFYYRQQKWARSIQTILKKEKYDVIVSFMSSTFYASVTAADIYARKHKIKHVCYCVDAIPAPFPWERDGLYSEAMKRFIRKRMQNVDVLCMTNKEMLDYEINIIGKEPGCKLVLPNPPSYNGFYDLPNDKLESSFAFAGKVYGVRNPDAIIDGFHLFLQQHPNSKLYFVGSGGLEKYLKNKGTSLENIVFLSYTDNLVSIYERCIGLIDINANTDNDVFLSSKLISYLPYNRIIISESGENSPSRNMFEGMESIIHVHHDKNEIFKAMEYCFANNCKTNYFERKFFIEQMGLPKVSDKLCDVIFKI